MQREGTRVVLASCSGTGLSFLGSIIAARLLGVEGFGLYAWAWAVLMSAVVLGSFGFPKLVLREVGRRSVASSVGGPTRILPWAVKRGVSVSIALAAALVALAYLSHASSAKIRVLALFLFVLPLFVTHRLMQSAVSGLGSVAISESLDNVVRPLVFISLCTLLLVMARREASPPLIVAFQAFGALAAVAVGAVLYRKGKAATESSATHSEVNRERSWWKTSSALLMLSIGGIVYQYADIVLLGSIDSNRAAGVYKVGVQLAGVVLLARYGFFKALEPRIAKLRSLGATAQMQDEVRDALRLSLLAACAVVAAYWVWGGDIVQGLYGPSYAGADRALMVLAGGNLLVVAFGPSTEVATMTGRQSGIAVIYVVGALLNVGLNVEWIPRYGYVGAAWAAAASGFVLSGAAWFWTRRTSGVAIGIEALFRRHVGRGPHRS